MAKLLTREAFAALTPGDHVWVELYGWHRTEDWVVGTIYFDHPELKGLWKRQGRRAVGHVFDFNTDQVRFWDSSPSPEELTMASWGAVKVQQ